MRIASIVFVLALGCSSGSKGPPLVFPLVNTTLERGELGRPGWGYSRVFETDLDKDGKDERVILLAQVEMRNNQPLWDDSQTWQVYIEEPDGERSYVYSRIIQLGKLEMRISHDGIQPRILLWEDMPTVYALYEITYKGPQDWVTAALAQRHLDPRSFRGQ